MAGVACFEDPRFTLRNLHAVSNHDQKFGEAVNST